MPSVTSRCLCGALSMPAGTTSMRRGGRAPVRARAITHLAAMLMLASLSVAAHSSERAGDARSKALSIVLTGQALIHDDFRVRSPSTIAAMKPLLQGDVVFTNFEGAIREGSEAGKGFLTGEGFHAPSVAAPPAAMDAVKEMGFNLVSLANNHAWDLQAAGIANTRRAAGKLGIVHAGTGDNVGQAAAPAYLDTPNGRVGLVAMASGSIAAGAGATAERAGVNELGVKDRSLPDAVDKQRILASIREAAGHSDVVISYHHNHVFKSSAPFFTMMNEQLPERLMPPEWIKAWAHEQVDAGANIVVMHGAPLLHGVEVYKGSVILYDLGNFIFQLAPTPPRFEETMSWRSVVAYVEMKNRKLQSVKFRPIAINKGRDDGDRELALRGMPAPAKGDQARYTLERLALLSQPFGTKMQIDGDVAEVQLAR